MVKHLNPQRTLEVQFGHQVVAKPVDWLWHPWLPRGVVAVIDGDPGLGKSSLTLDLVARISSGKPFPNSDEPALNSALAEAPPPPKPQVLALDPFELRNPHGGINRSPSKYSLVVSLEDPIDTVVIPRLQAAGADLSKVAILGGVTEPDAEGEVQGILQLPRDLDLIRARIVELRPALIVIDPLFAVLGYDEEGRFIKASDDQSVRRLTSKLRRLAEQFGVTILLVRHLNKTLAGSAVQRGSGSIAIAAQARSVMLVGHDPDDPAGRFLAMTKSNLAASPPTLRFRIASASPGSRVEWLGESDLTADDLMQNRNTAEIRKAAVDDAMFFLRRRLGRGEAAWADLVSDARKEYISERTLRRARTKLELEIVYTGRAKPVWRLPPIELIRLPK